MILPLLLLLLLLLLFCILEQLKNCCQLLKISISRVITSCLSDCYISGIFLSLQNLKTILDKNYETNVSFYEKMNCFYTCPFPPHSMLTKLHRVVSLSFNIDIRGKGGLKYSYSELELRIHKFYLNFCCCLNIFCPRLSVKKIKQNFISYI